jgi:S-adenosylmethionine synthetase
MSLVRKSKQSDGIAWMWPDGKVQVTMECQLNEHGVPVPLRLHTVVISVQHPPDLDFVTIESDMINGVIKPTVPAKFFTSETIIHVNPGGRFVIGGPHADSGMTGRKTMADAYGGWANGGGGGGFSGKDPAHPDRGMAYAARWIAKSLVHHELCRRCTVQLAWAIAVPYPIAVTVDSHGTCIVGRKKLIQHAALDEENPKAEDEVDYSVLDAILEKVVKDSFDLRIGMLVKRMDMRKPMFQATATFGHFGREETGFFVWENVPPDLEI